MQCCAALTVECLTLPHLEVKCAYIHSPSKQLEAEARTQLLGLVQEKEEDEDEAMEDVSEGEGGDSGNDEEDVDPDGNNEEGSGPDSSEDDPNPEQSDEDEDYEGDSSEREQTPGLEGKNNADNSPSINEDSRISVRGSPNKWSHDPA